MKTLTLMFLLVVISKGNFAQIPKKLITPVLIDFDFKDTLTFSKNWDYPWYVTKDSNGRFLSSIYSPVRPSDTTRQFYTADCMSTHQGMHKIRYCTASRQNGILSLFFQPEPPGYSGELIVKIFNNNFECSYWAANPYMAYSAWLITEQKLTMGNPDYQTGKFVLGYIKVNFTEMVRTTGVTGSLSGYKRFNHVFEGYFKTPVSD